MDKQKQAAGIKASEFIQPGMIVGLGTGSTAAFFIQALIDKKLPIKTVASSKASAKMAREGGLEVLEITDVSHIDITVDGADEIDPKKRMIKGGGGAHTREKILAAASREMIVIVDESKLVSNLGRIKLPVEITPYGSNFTEKHLKDLDLHGSWRSTKEGKLFITDNGNLIFDIQLASPTLSPESLHEKILHIPGVVDTGFFFHLAGRVIVGHSDGSTSFLN